MTVVGVVVVMGVLAVVLLRSRVLRWGGFCYAAIWGFLLGTTPAGPQVGAVLDAAGAWAWSLVGSL